MMKRHPKKWLLAVAVAAVAAMPLQAAIAPVASAAAQQQSSAIAVYVDDSQIAFGQAPVQKNGVVMVPMRQIFTALSAQMTWIEETKTVIVRKDGTSLSIKIGARQAVVNGRTVELAEPAQIVGGQTMVPLRFVGEALGAEIEWDGATRTARITSAERLLELELEQQEEAGDGRLTPAEIVDLNDGRTVMIRTDAGQGSGVVIGDYYIMTNYHVASGATEGVATTSWGEAFDIAGVAAADEDADLAIVMTEEALGIEPVEFGFSSEVRKGDRVVAIGSPLGLQNTVSEGLISNITNENGALYFQTNVPIDHGSSGGGLFDEYGRLIGITTSGIADTTADLNFAIASDHAVALIRQFISDGDSEVAFPPSGLPDSLKDADNDEIRELMEKRYGRTQTSQGTATFDNWTVERDADGWIVISSVISPSFYMVYGDKASHELRVWALNLGGDLKRMLPDEKIQFVVYYEQTFDAEPRGFEADEVTALGDGKWRLRYDVIDLQIMDRMHIRMRT